MAGALIGLLFVAVSVAPDRVSTSTADRRSQVRASSALTSFVNALAISLFALIPGVGFDSSVIVIATIGLLFVLGSFLALHRDRHDWRLPWSDLAMLTGLLVVYGIELAEGIRMSLDGVSADAVSTVAVLVCVCFFIGISRAWELIDGPSIGLLSELRATRDREGRPGRAGRDPRAKEHT